MARCECRAYGSSTLSCYIASQRFGSPRPSTRLIKRLTAVPLDGSRTSSSMHSKNWTCDSSLVDRSRQKCVTELVLATIFIASVIPFVPGMHLSYSGLHGVMNDLIVNVK
jgi:hypothetical protein